MKKTKVKKIKKIPGYSNGELSVKSNPIAGLTMQTPGLKVDTTAALRGFGNKIKNGLNAVGDALGGTAGIAGIVGGAAESVAGALGIEQTAASKAIGQVGQAIGTFNPVIGAGFQILGATMGAGAKFDESKVSTTSDIQDAVSHNTGWGGALFGRDRNKLLRTANTYQNSLVAAERTSQAQLEWANDPANQGTVSTLKEGGIVPGEHYASRNEVEVDANGNNAVRYKWDPKGKDTYHVMFNPDGSLTEGNMIFNDEGVRRPDGTKYSDTADKMIKNIKDPKLRKISLKKLAAEQEEQKEKEGKTKNGIPAHAKGGIQWNDLAYQTAAMLTPLLDKEKAETTRLQRPTWKAAPVAVDALNQLQDAQLGYTLANYNTAQGGYTAGQQLAAKGAAASNLARQRAAIHQWQTEQQNKNIAQNIASYNNYANIVADIANKEIDINAANRAAARNINRQNRASALKAWGQINSDSNKRNMDKLRIAVAAPMFKYGMENYDEMVKMLTDMGLWQ